MRSRRRTHHSHVAWSGSDEEFQSQTPQPAWDAAWDRVRAERKQAGLPNTYRAAEAVALFCYRAKTWLGALAAALGGLDTLVFAGGIGENSPEARRRICDGLEFLGIAVDEHRNAASASLISTEDCRVAVRVIPTDEELLIARAAAGFTPRSQETLAANS